MKHYLVTGYSSKMDGFVYVVQAESRKEAKEKVRDFYSMPEKPWHLVDRVFEWQESGETHQFLVPDEQKEEPSLDDSSARWCWEIFATVVVEDTNLADAVCW